MEADAKRYMRTTVMTYVGARRSSVTVDAGSLVTCYIALNQEATAIGVGRLIFSWFSICDLASTLIPCPTALRVADA